MASRRDGYFTFTTACVSSDQWDEEVRAVVAPRPDASLSERELQEHCRSTIAGYKIPKRIRVGALEEIQVEPSGKIMKRELRAKDLWPDLVQPA